MFAGGLVGMERVEAMARRRMKKRKGSGNSEVVVEGTAFG